MSPSLLSSTVSFGHRLDSALAQVRDKAEVNVEWHAFLLDPNFAEEGKFSASLEGGSVEKKRLQILPCKLLRQGNMPACNTLHILFQKILRAVKHLNK